MSAPVDVLAVLDRTNEALLHGDPAPSLADLKEARAAVAELIEAADQTYAFLCEKAPATATAFRLRKSLVRARGAA